MKISRDQLFIALYFIFWTGNCIINHALSMGFVDATREYAALQETRSETDPPLAPTSQQLGRGMILMITNFPLFVTIGPISRSPTEQLHWSYWPILIIGSALLPFIGALLFFFLLHPPCGGSTFPGVEWDDGSLKDEIDDDDER